MQFLLFLSICLAKNPGAQTRCETINCICELQAPPKKAPESWILEIFFNEDSSKISSAQQQKLKNWGYRPAIIIGSTDGCGSHQHNQQLAADRLRSTQRHLQRVIKTQNLGEISTSHRWDTRRVLVVDPHFRMLWLIATYPADYYLIDGSGSMKSYWEEISRFPFATDAEIYLAKTNNCFNGQLVDRATPDGPTEIWMPYYRLIQRAIPGSIILIVSDFNSEVPLSDFEHRRLKEMAENKNLTIHVIKYRNENGRYYGKVPGETTSTTH